MLSYFKAKGGWKYFLPVLFILVYSCSPKFVRNKEAREDDRAFQVATTAQAVISNTIYPSVETTPVICDKPDADAADDPAIWYNEENPSLSVVFGSNKKKGIHAYNLEGKELQFIACGK